MDEKSKGQAAVGGIGAAIGFAIGGPPGAAVGGLGGAILGGREDDHPALVRETYYELDDATAESARIYVDHIDVDGDAGNPEGEVGGLDMVPDIVVKQNGANLIIEAETFAGVTDAPQHAVDQLNDFQTNGYKRLLVAPADEAEQVYEWAEEVEDEELVEKEIHVTTPESVSKFV